MTDMRNSKKYFIAIEFLLGTAVLVLALMMLGERNRDILGRVSVIVCDSDNAQWASFKYGLRKAAEDRGIEVMIVGTESTLGMEEEENLIESEIDNGADAVIVQPVPGDGAEDMLEKMRKRVPLMLVGRVLPENENRSDLPVAETDDYALGAALAEELLKDYSGNMEGKSIGILSRTTDSGVTAKREEGFWNVLKDSGVELEWRVAGNFEGSGTGHLKNQPKVDLIAALDDYSLTAAGACSAAGDLHGARIYGIGHSTEAAYYLDNGTVECLVVPDEFGMGYQCMSEIADCLENAFYKAKDRTVSYAVMRRENLFSKENQEILFTMSQ